MRKQGVDPFADERQAAPSVPGDSEPQTPQRIQRTNDAVFLRTVKAQKESASAGMDCGRRSGDRGPPGLSAGGPGVGRPLGVHCVSGECTKGPWLPHPTHTHHGKKPKKNPAQTPWCGTPPKGAAYNTPRRTRATRYSVVVVGWPATHRSRHTPLKTDATRMAACRWQL